MMEEVEKFCEQLKKDYHNVRRFYVIGISVFGLFFIGAFGNNMVLHNTVQQQGEHIDVIRKNYITYENFFLFNRTYELQLEQTQAVLNDDTERVKALQEQYNELRSMIVMQRAIRSSKTE